VSCLESYQKNLILGRFEIAVQNTFRLEMHQDDVFLLFKIIFDISASK
jgi:hypothetical protein